MSCSVTNGLHKTTILAAALSTLALCAASGVSGKSKTTVLRPVESVPKVVVRVAGKERVYHALGSHGWTTIQVNGPGELRILTRSQCVSSRADAIGYSVAFRVDAAQPEEFQVEDSAPAAHASFVTGMSGVPGESEVCLLKVRPGRHTVRLMVRDSVTLVVARFLFTTGATKKTRWVSLAPLNPVEPVDLIAGEETVHYYRFSPDRPLRVSIIGPTRLRIMTRVENSFSMKGRANYRLQVTHNGEVLQSYQLSSKRSESTVYKHDMKHVPGRAREIVIVVPKGPQSYDIIPLDKETLLGQVTFPQKDVHLGL